MIRSRRWFRDGAALAAAARSAGPEHTQWDTRPIGGTFAHAIDFDDTHLPSVLHPSAAIVPAALACTDRRPALTAERFWLLWRSAMR